MIKRFPFTSQQALDKPGETRAPVLAEARQVQNHDENQAWIRWAFQSARLRCGALMFQPKDTLRPVLIANWKSFVEAFWQPLLAPAMLSAWKASTRACEEDFDFIATTLNRDLPAHLAARSIEAGNWLLESTRGAKYQGSLGRLRQKVDEGRLEPHLPIVWAVTAALFQLTPAEMLAAEIGEEWHAAAVACAEPSGLLSFASLAHSALRSSNILQFPDGEHSRNLE